ncbi:MAG: N-acetylmuramoyl-L-alanine amidase [Chloroflexi bacterium]|nr:N-acetylmuramoyl-L-alanine amidase [Chloroflexota bacterium]
MNSSLIKKIGQFGALALFFSVIWVLAQAWGEKEEGLPGRAPDFVVEGGPAASGESLSLVLGEDLTNIPQTSELVCVEKEPGERVIVVDPGHGGPFEVGAVHRNAWGEADVVEKEVNLKIALVLRDLLSGDGYEVVLTRDGDTGALDPEAADTFSGYRRTRADLQARVDIANSACADLFISVHNNGSTSPGESGTEVWYSKDRPFAAENLALARLVQANLLAQLREVGYSSRDRGVKDDSNFRVFQGRTYNLFVLGPGRPGARATQMPGILGESIFVSNDVEASLLQQDRVIEAIAQGYYQSIISYFEQRNTAAS